MKKLILITVFLALSTVLFSAEEQAPWAMTGVEISIDEITGWHAPMEVCEHTITYRVDAGPYQPMPGVMRITYSGAGGERKSGRYEWEVYPWFRVDIVVEDGYRAYFSGRGAPTEWNNKVRASISIDNCGVYTPDTWIVSPVFVMSFRIPTH